jgi:hypothetical protein
VIPANNYEAGAKIFRFYHFSFSSRIILHSSFDFNALLWLLPFQMRRGA